MSSVVIFGATSAIAQATARAMAREGASFYLVARDGAKLQVVADDLKARGAGSVTTDVADLGDLHSLPGVVSRLEARVAAPDIVFMAHGIQGDESKTQFQFSEAETVFRVNFLSFMALLTPLAALMERRKAGVIAVVSSVAGDRGRQSNYVYGSSKAALSAFTSGLRNRLSKSGVHVLTVKPGFVATPMTAHLKQGPLFASAEMVGEGLFKAIKARRDIAYLPGFWALIMFIIRSIPERLFKKMKL